MRKLSLATFVIGAALAVALFLAPLQVQAAPGARNAVQIADPYELIAAVNNLRTANGLPTYNPHPILMQIAQAHSEYQAAIGTWTHIGPDGSRPYQRALAAGYAVAGDLTLGGFFSENVINGINMSAEEAVQAWLGDAPHTNTMLSANLQDIGAGVATDGNRVYYTIDVGRSTGGQPAATPPSSGTTGAGTQAATAFTTVTVYPVTPNAEGAIIHVVQPGETVWAIALAYGVSEQEIIANNPLMGSFIYPGDRLVIISGFTPTPTAPTSTPTLRATPTLWPTTTSAPLEPPFPTGTSEAAIPRSTGAGIAGAIVALAILLPAAIVLLSARNRKS
ncbi:MAG: LysM peptidoglycan-binding domain-containing protein [Anaerolineales bacterium]|nr:LysM peptidoglycan-binding domain-containing protein [Anaerolineales bacterium]